MTTTVRPPLSPSIDSIKPGSLAWMADPGRWAVRDTDRELFERKLRSFVPPDIFDVHAHLYDCRHLAPEVPAHEWAGPPEVGFDAMLAQQSRWMGDRAPTGGLFFPFPKKTLDSRLSNAFLARELSRHPGSRGLMMVSPNDGPAAVEAEVARYAWAGFKVYHLYADRPDTQQADQGEFLPEWLWEIAHRRGLAITMHMVLDRSLADPRNQHYIREHCLKYPGVKYILAHAGRGFCGHHTVEGIDSLRGLDNVFFDTSAVCEAAPFEAVLRVFGPTRLMYGSDFMVSESRGRAISVGDGFFWVYEDNAKWDGWTFARPTLVGIESLLALRQACRTMSLNDADVERIFSTNARQMLGVTPLPPATKGSGQAAYLHAKTLIPGGTQLLSKRPELFAPDQWPAYYREARGCEVIDLDGRRYTDMSISGIGSCLLGYADPDVTAAVVRRVQLGSMCTLNNPEEIELAELLTAMHPWSGAARFCRAGGEAMAIAVRIARACTGRDLVAVCGYHGWADWYVAANLASNQRLNGHLLPGLDPSGVPAGLTGSALPFNYNQLDELAAIVREHGGKLAAVVMEPTRAADPRPGFLEGVRELCDRSGARLVLDEITIGFRLARGGAHLKYGLTPDLAVFAKALGNGHPIGAVIGKKDVMAAAQGSFISSTYWTEGVGPAAAVATLRKMRRIDLPAHLARVGGRMRQGWLDLAKQHGLPIKVGGHPALSNFAFDHPDAAALTTLFTVRMLGRGFLAGGAFYATLAHEERHVDACLAAADGAFAELAEAIRKGDARERIGGPVKHTGFARLA